MNPVTTAETIHGTEIVSNARCRTSNGYKPKTWRYRALWRHHRRWQKVWISIQCYIYRWLPEPLQLCVRYINDVYVLRPVKYVPSVAGYINDVWTIERTESCS